MNMASATDTYIFIVVYNSWRHDHRQVALPEVNRLNH